jgi:hypothetical protein
MGALPQYLLLNSCLSHAADLRSVYIKSPYKHVPAVYSEANDLVSYTKFPLTFHVYMYIYMCVCVCVHILSISTFCFSVYLYNAREEKFPATVRDIYCSFPRGYISRGVNCYVLVDKRLSFIFHYKQYFARLCNGFLGHLKVNHVFAWSDSSRVICQYICFVMRSLIWMLEIGTIW